MNISFFQSLQFHVVLLESFFQTSLQKMNKRINIIFGLIVLIGCSPEKRLNNLLSKNPELVKTEIVHDTVIVKEVVHDTITKIVFNDSVVVVNNERVKLQYFYDTLRQEIYHDVECKEVPVVYEKKIVTVQPPKKPFNWWLLLLSLIVVLLILKIFLGRKS